MTLWLSLLVAYVGFSVNINGQIPVDPNSCPGDRHQAWLDTSVKDSQNSRYCAEGSPPGALNSVTDPRDPYVSLTTLAAPKDARKAYERAKKEMGKKTPDLAKAAGELERAVGLYPAYAAAWHLFGITRMVLGETARATEAFQRAIAADANYDRPYLSLANLELSQSRFAEAAALTDRLIQLNPSLTEAHYFRAWAHAYLGHRATARESISTILKRGEEERFPEVHALLAFFYAAEGKADLAAAEYRRLVELRPNSAVADATRRELEERKALELVK